MNDFENDLKRTLSDNVSYRSNWGEDLKYNATRPFHKRLQWVELATMGFLLVLLLATLVRLRNTRNRLRAMVKEMEHE